jgi:hypothetical protein
VQPKGTKSDLVVLTAQRSVWDPKRQAWRRESPLPAPPMKRTGGAAEQGAWLANYVMREIAARSIKIDAKPAGDGAKVVLRNELPVPLERLRLSDRSDAALDILLERISLPAGGKATAEIPATEAARLLAAKKPIVTSFQAASQTR